MGFGGTKELDSFELGNKEKISFRSVATKIFAGRETMGSGNETEAQK